MASTIVGYFDDYTEARRAEQDLLNSGVSAQYVQIVGRDAEGKTTENWWERFKSAFGMVGDDDRSYYQHAAERGALLTVRVSSEQQLNEVAEIIERHHPADLSRKNEEWGVGSTAATARTGTTTGTTTSAVASATSQTGASESIPLAQEELLVGKRAVQRGALRVHSYVTETPVTENVALREESAYVERTAVNRPVEPGDATFKERTIEVQELGEEAVVSKTARVVEEVRVGKEQTQRQETVHDTVRKQEVDVERVDGATETRVDRDKRPVR